MARLILTQSGHRPFMGSTRIDLRLRMTARGRRLRRRMTPRPHGRSGRSAAKIKHPGDFTGAFVAGGETCFGVPDPNSPIPKRMCLPIFYREALFLSPHFFDGLARGRIGSFAERIIHVGAALVVPLEIKRVGPSHKSRNAGEFSRTADDLAAKGSVGPPCRAVRHNN